MKKLFVSIACLAAAAAQGTGTDIAYVNSNNDFAFALYGRIAGDSKGNIFFSPYSISSAMAMTYNGAKGETASQMSRALFFDTDTVKLNTEISVVNNSYNGANGLKGYELDVANALWGQKDYIFLEPFLASMRTYYGAQFNKLDFKSDTEGSRKTINRWVSDKTKDKIPELIKPGMLNIMTRLVLTNAIYFKGFWRSAFDKQDTKESDFYVTGTKVTKTRMMYKSGKDFSYCELEGVQALSLAYKGDMAMLIALPDKKIAIAEFEKKFAGGLFTRLITGLNQQRVEVYLPKFKSESEFELSSKLAGMGMPDAFNFGAADFSLMTGNKDLCISAVIHEAVVEVDEKGTVAAAATAVILLGGSRQVNPPVIFRADHPFMYFIYDTRTDMIIFMGRMMEPGEK